jgi:hypothetical protein
MEGSCESGNEPLGFIKCWEGIFRCKSWLDNMHFVPFEGIEVNLIPEIAEP